MDGNGKTILLVEDEAIIALSEARTLEKYGYNVITTSRGEEAVKTFTHTPAIDLVLMDVDLGKGIDGTQAAARMLSCRDVPVVFLSSHKEAVMVEKTEKITSYGYVVKDSGETVLIASMNMAFKLYEAHRQLKEREELLLASREKLNSTLTSMDDLVFVLDKEERFIDYFQPEKATAFVMQPTFLGRKFHDVLPASAGVPLAKAINSIRLGGPVDQYDCKLEQQGLVAWWSVKVSSRRDRFGNFDGVTIVCRDVTKRKLAEAQREAALSALRKSEARYHSLFENSPISLWLEDFSNVKKFLDRLKSKRVKDFRAYFKKHPETVPMCASIIQVIEVNRATLDLYSAKSQVEFHDGLACVFKEESYAVFLEELIAFASGKTRFESEAITRTLSGYLKHVMLVASVVPGCEETLSQVMVSIYDISERKHQEEELRLFKTMIEESGEAVAVFDPDGRITYINQAHERLFGYTRERALMLNLRDFLSPQSAMIFDHEMEEALVQGRGWEGEFDAIDARGRHIPVWQRLDAVLEETGIYLYGFGLFHDLSERKQAETRREMTLGALRETERRFREMLENVALIAVMLDQHGSLIFANDCFLALTGWKRNEILGRDWFEVFVPADPEVRSVFHAHITSGSIPPHYQNEILTKNGERLLVRWSNTILCDTAGSVVGTASIGEDITERARAEEVLKENEQFMRTLLDNLTVGVVIISPATRVIEDVNPEAARMLGLPREEIVDHTCHQFFCPAHKDSCPVVDLDQEIDRTERVMLCAEGKEVPVIKTVKKIFVSGCEKLLECFMDLSDLKKAEQVLAQALVEKEALLSEFQHRVKNSIALISSLLSLDTDAVSDPAAHNILQHIQDRIKSISTLYEMLSISGTTYEVRLDEYIRRIAESLAAAYIRGKRGVTLLNACDSISLDARRSAPFGLIVNELVTNALKYAFPGDKTGTISVALRQHNGDIVLEVADDGVGLPCGFDLEHPAGMGTKLITLLTSQLGGTVTVTRDKGTMFSVRVPLGDTAT